MLIMYYIMCPAFFGSVGAVLLAASFDYIAVIADASIGAHHTGEQPSLARIDSYDDRILQVR